VEGEGRANLALLRLPGFHRQVIAVWMRRDCGHSLEMIARQKTFLTIKFSHVSALRKRKSAIVVAGTNNLKDE
jgi:hypothetical protein